MSFVFFFLNASEYIQNHYFFLEDILYLSMGYSVCLIYYLKLGWII